jgi:hypothetical protein
MKRPRLGSEQRRFIWITVFVFIMLIVVDHYRPDDLLIAASLAIAVYTLYFAGLSLKASTDSLELTKDSLEVTKKALELTTLDVTTRIRPWVTVYHLHADFIQIEQGEPPIVLSKLSFFICNNGTVPASSVKAEMILLGNDSNDALVTKVEEDPGLPPNISVTFFLGLSPFLPIQQLIYDEKVRVQIHLTYLGPVGTVHETVQTYNIQKDRTFTGRVESGEFQYIFSPTPPMTFT